MLSLLDVMMYVALVMGGLAIIIFIFMMPLYYVNKLFMRDKLWLPLTILAVWIYLLFVSVIYLSTHVTGWLGYGINN